MTSCLTSTFSHPWRGASSRSPWRTSRRSSATRPSQDHWTWKVDREINLYYLYLNVNNALLFKSNKIFWNLKTFFYFPQTEPQQTVDVGWLLQLAESLMAPRLVNIEETILRLNIFPQGVPNAQQTLPSLPSVLLHSGLRHVRSYPNQQGLKCFLDVTYPIMMP